MKKAIVTGATGFIGSHLVKELLDNEYEVFAVVRPNSSNLYKLQQNSKLHIIELDLKNILDLEEQIKERDFSCFFHMAWEGVSGEAHTNPNIQIENVKIAINCIRTAIKMQCTRFIGAGSVHETECKVEMAEPRQIQNVRNFYKAAKLMAHYYCKLEAASNGIDFVWPIITNTYGAGEFSGRLINSTIRKLLDGTEPNFTKGDQLYDFIYVTDVARAYRMIAEKGKSFENYIVGSGNVQTLREYLEKIGKLINPDIKLNFGAVGTGVYLKEEDLYNNNLYKDTGFEVKISFEQGIMLTKEWIKNMRT